MLNLLSATGTGLLLAGLVYAGNNGNGVSPFIAGSTVTVAVRVTDAELVTIRQIHPVFVGFSVPENRLAEVKKYMAAALVAGLVWVLLSRALYRWSLAQDASGDRWLTADDAPATSGEGR